MSDVVAFSVQRSKTDFFWAVFWATFRNARVWTVYVLGGLLVAGISFFNSDGGLEGKLASAGIAFAVLMTAYAIILVVSVALVSLKNWNMVGAFDSIAFEMSDRGMKITSATSSGESNWAIWKTFFETRTLIIIRHQTGLVQIVPKRELSASLLAQVREMLARNLGAGRARGAAAS